MKWGREEISHKQERDQDSPLRICLQVALATWPAPSGALRSGRRQLTRLRNSWRTRPGSPDHATPAFGVTWQMTGCGTFAISIWSCSVGKKGRQELWHPAPSD